jgi:hypothetical protein
MHFHMHGTILFFHIVYNVLCLSNSHLPNTPFLKNVTSMMDDGVLCTESHCSGKYGIDYVLHVGSL